VLDDEFGVLLSGLNQLKAELPGTDDFDPAALVNSDGTVNLDLEGVARDLDGVSFWVASEGSGNLVGGVSDPNNRPFQSPNMLVRYINQPGFPPFVGPFDGITQVVFPPVELTREQLRFGFEGVALTGDVLAGETRDIWVCFQREWQNAGDPAGFVRIGRYNLFSQSWTYAYYPLDTPASPNGGWVGLSDLTHIAGPRFAVIERDDQGGPDAAIKRIYQFSVAGVQFQGNSQAPNFPVLTKKLVVDLIGADTYGPAGGLIPEKLEGLCLLPGGTLLVVNDNDGVDDNNGETQLIELKNVID
jgi:hypothetical protein